MTEAYKDLARAFLAALDRNDWDWAPAHVTPDFRMEVAGQPPMDLEAMLAFAKAFYAGFPDLTHDITEMWCDGQDVMMKIVVHGTQTGEFNGIPATGRSVEFGGLTVGHLAGDKAQSI